MSIINALRQRGFARTEFIQLRINLLGPTLALANAEASRYMLADTQLKQMGATYLLRKNADQWGIVVLTVHSPDVST